METSSVGRPTFGGIASGLDTSALLEGLLALERQPLQRIERQRSEVDSQRGLMRELNTKLLALRSASQKLDNRNSTGSNASLDEEFLSYKGSSSNEEIVSVSASTGAAPGEIDITVRQLARGSREFSREFTEAQADRALRARRSFTISLDNADPTAVPPIEATSITIEAGSSALSLSDIRDQINTAEENAGNIRADILRTSDDSMRLVLSSTGTGPENQMTISGRLTMDDDLSVSAEGSVFEVFGQEITRSSNLVDDVLTGITLRLESISEPVTEGDDGDPLEIPLVAETVTVDIDVDEVAANLEEFTNAYNDVMSFMDRQFRYDEASGRAGPLSGDSTLRRIQGQLRSFVSRGFAFANNPNNPFTNGGQGGVISGVGIEIGSGGTLSVDREKLEEALARDALSVREFFSGRVNTVDPVVDSEEDSEEDSAVNFDNGFAELFSSQLDELVRSGDGTLAKRDEAYVDRLSDFDDSIDRFARRIAQREETLIQRFSDLERIVSGLQSQQGFLGSLG